MQSEFYPFQSDDDRLYFEFLSVGPKKIIRKAVYFTLINTEVNLYNLSLVDILSDGTHCDIAVSNNGDFEKVMSTVAGCIAVFFQQYPAARIYIKGSSPSRTRLYRIVFTKELLRIRKNYELYGATESVVEPFEADKKYDVYLLNLKK
jgi:hypothetical protein